MGDIHKREDTDSVERPEEIPGMHLAGKLTFVRHGQTLYTGEYPDLTEKGTATIEAAAEEVRKHLSSEDEAIFVTSPLPRAKGSVDILRRALDAKSEAQVAEIIRCMDMPDLERATAIFQELSADGGTKSVDLAYHTDPRFEDAAIYEQRSAVRERMLRAVTLAIHLFERKSKDISRQLHVIGVSHYEVLSHLVYEVFGHPADGTTLQHGEPVHLMVYLPDDKKDRKHATLIVRFRGEERKVLFDRDARKITL